MSTGCVCELHAGECRPGAGKYQVHAGGGVVVSVLVVVVVVVLVAVVVLMVDLEGRRPVWTSGKSHQIELFLLGCSGTN